MARRNKWNRNRPNKGEATAVVFALLLVAQGCGGTLEEKYRRGELTTTTTTGPGTPGTPSPTNTTSTTTSPPVTGGNAAGQPAQGEPGGSETGGTIVGSAMARNVQPPLGGRHR